MPFSFTMPKLSPTMEEGVIVKWHKKVGEYVELGEVLLDVATDKATIEHQSHEEGYLRKIVIQENESAKVNQAIAIFSESKDESIDSFAIPKPVEITSEEPVSKTSSKEKKPEVAAKALGGLQEPIFKPQPPLSDYKYGFPTEKELERVQASPLAKKIAKEQGLDLRTISGTGPSGRIVERDLAKAQKKAVVSSGTREAPTHAPGSFTLEKMTPMRQAIAKRLQQSKTFIPHFYLEKRINAGKLSELRKQVKEHYGLHITVNDLILRACALALRACPAVNAGYDSEEQAIVKYETIDISVAVSVQGGLITPIIRYCDFKKVGEIGAEVRALAKKAKEGSLDPSEYQGGSFTVSNLGMYGITSFQAIINPPQAAILAVGALEKAPIVENGELKVGDVMHLNLSCDHRVIDGAEGAKFLKTLSLYLENPAGLLV